MTGDEPLHALARGDGDGLLHHLLVDQAIKVAIVLVALLVLALGMRLIWKKAGRAGPPRRDDR
ncbi:hypothetical protein Sgleb_64640 [Streptomyces glebosus]|uniref:Uncharacterized protein n=1 Tax=Streptomyces glebosus TaxID=249580 RepID=A0A640T3T9_9ACTN|nr:hypothetical protein [Streptomyces glebosus]GFE18417.1 hypothetical protein Sgleb_64640 [Streptomyces glebosus]GHG58606.1 hypothetical protein GCM10010513_22870 [Streptomyces glebosus]